MTIAVVSHDYDFIDAVCTDVTHYDNGGDLGKPCKFVYYPMTFSEFQRLKPEIAAGLPHADKGVATAAQVVGENKTPSESDASSEKGMGSRSSSVRAPGRASDPRRLPRARAAPMQQLTPPAPLPLQVGSGMDGLSLSSNNSSEGAGLTSTINRVDEMIAAGLILPMRFPDPGKPEGIRTFRKPILTMKVRWDAPRTPGAARRSHHRSLTPLLLPLYHRSLTPLLPPPLHRTSRSSTPRRRSGSSRRRTPRSPSARAP